MARIFAIILMCFLTSVGITQAQDETPIPVLNRDYYIEAAVDNPTPFVGQQIVYSFHFHYAITLPDPLYSPPDFQGFWQADLGPATKYTQLIDGRQYTITKLDTVLYPNTPGTLTIPASTLTLPSTVFRDEETLTTNPVTVEVQPLPEGAPENFNGAVGQFGMTASINRQSAALGEPITLQLAISGAGNLEQVTAPEWPVPEGWRVYPNPTTFTTVGEGGALVGEKVFEWLLVPDESGSQTLPEISLSFFDPQTLTYRSVSTAPVTLEIFPPEDPDVILPELPLSSEGVLPLKPVPAQLSAQGIYPGLGFWALWGIPPALAVLGLVWVQREKRKVKDRVKIQRSRALTRAQERLHNAHRRHSNEGYRLVIEAVFRYFSDKLDVEAGGLTQSDLERIMSEQGIGISVIEEIIACLEHADEGLYAPVGEADVRVLVERTMQALTAVDVAWRTV
jgi:hypothetical protein